MKVVALVLIALMTSSLCLAAPGRALRITTLTNDGVPDEPTTAHDPLTTGHPDENHHNIPREHYNQWGSSTPSGGGGGGDGSNSGNGGG
ncbi:hypothetical protein ACS0TY_015330 [Phlomoides rotata]